MLKRRSVSGPDGTIWQSIKEADTSQEAIDDAPAQVRVTFQCSLREVEVTLPATWTDTSTWPDWVILGEIERELSRK